MITIYLKQYNKIIRNADTKLFDELGYDDILWIDMLLPTIKEQKARTRVCWSRCAAPSSGPSARRKNGSR